MPITLGMLKPVVDLALPVSLNFLNTTVNNTTSGNNTVFTFNNVNFGTPSPTRCIVAYVSGFLSAGGGSLVSVQLGGVEATISQFSVGSNTFTNAIAIARVPAGATGTVRVQYNKAYNQNRVCISAFDNIMDTNPVDFQHVANTGTSVATPALAFKKGGLVTALECSQNARTHTWTNVTESRDSTVSSFAWSTADAYPLANESLPVSVVTSSSMPNGSLVAVSFR